MSKAKQTPVAEVANPSAAAPAAPAAPVTPKAAPAFDVEAVKAQGAALASADSTFDAAIAAVSQAVARILGTKPTFDLWESVAAEFQGAYAKARGCNSETARKRWSAVATYMGENWELTKPVKPTQAAAKKAEQRENSAEMAKRIIAEAKATNAQEIMAIAADSTRGLTKGVVQEIVKAASARATEAQAAAAEAAKKRAGELRETLRKECQSLTVAELERVAAFVIEVKAERSKPAPTPPAAPETPAPAPAPETANG